VFLEKESGGTMIRNPQSKKRSSMKTSLEITGKGSALVRKKYMIHGFRVAFESGGGWHCVCREFKSSNLCIHTREAAGMRTAQAQIQAGLATGRSLFAQRAAADKQRDLAHLFDKQL
jgi:hypothetical protein